jgi:Reverse transcriptase (RNA-dependent DNA polymerase)
LNEKKLPSKTINFLYQILWKKELLFFSNGQVYLTRVGYKGLPQGSVLSPFLYNILGSCVDRYIPSGCGFLQYADDIVIYAAHRLFNVAHGLVQTALTALVVFFNSMGLSISASKSETMLFSRKHDRPSLSIIIGSHTLPQAKTFKYLGVYFDEGLRWTVHANYVKKRCLQRLNLLRPVAGVSWGAHPTSMLILYKGLVGSVLEYGSICYTGMSKTNKFNLER